MLLQFLTDCCSIFDQFSDPLETLESAWRLHESSIFDLLDLLFSRTFFGPKNYPKITPKLIIFASFLVPGPLPEPPGAILDALRALRELFGSSLKLLNHFKIHIFFGALGTLLGPQERPKGPSWAPKSAPRAQTGPKMLPKWSRNRWRAGVVQICLPKCHTCSKNEERNVEIYRVCERQTS